MAKQIKRFWLRLTAMFLTLYFAPLSHMLMSLFGIKDAGEANAKTVYCHTRSASCRDPNPDKTNFFVGDVVRCNCGDSTHPEMGYELRCVDNKRWDSIRSEWDHYYTWDQEGDCVAECEEGDTKDCSTTQRYGTRQCVTSSGTWGACVWGDCKSGYVMVSDECLTACTIANGSGYEKIVSEVSSSSSSSEA